MQNYVIIAYLSLYYAFPLPESGFDWKERKRKKLTKFGRFFKMRKIKKMEIGHPFPTNISAVRRSTTSKTGIGQNGRIRVDL
jgi:hypothetical protein